MRNSADKLDKIMAFFYMYVDFYNTSTIAESVTMSETEIDIYINEIKNLNLIDKNDNSEFRINFNGIKFCETDSFRNTDEKKYTICKLYNLIK